MSLGTAFSRVLKAHKVSQSELARRLGVTSQAVNQWAKSKTNFTAERQGKIADALGISVIDLVSQIAGAGAGEDLFAVIDRKEKAPSGENLQQIDDIRFRGEEFAAVAVYDAHASAGPGALNSEHAEPIGYRIFPVQWLRTLSRSAASSLAILMVAGDSMEPTLQNGDNIMIDIGVRHLGRDGLYVIAAEHEVQVKRLSRDPRDRSITIRSDNPKAESWTGVPEDQVHVLGRVVWLSRSVEG